MVGKKYTTFYLPWLILACILLKIEVYNAVQMTLGRNPLQIFFSTKGSICSFFTTFFSRRCTIISYLDFDFERVLKLQQLLYFYPKNQAFCKSSETTDHMKLDSSPDTDSSCEENSDCRWQIVQKKITRPKVDVMFKGAAEMFKNDIKTLKEHIYVKRTQTNAYNEIEASLSKNDLILHVDFEENNKNDQQDAIQSAHYRN